MANLYLLYRSMYYRHALGLAIKTMNNFYQGYGKYNVAPISDRTTDGITFASKMEMKRYLQLKLLVRAGEISDLSCQPRFLLQEGFDRNGTHYKPIYYVADFLYYDKKLKRKVAEDVKGAKTEVFKIKEKLFHFRHNMELRLVEKV